MNLHLSTNVSARTGEQVHRVCFSSHRARGVRVKGNWARVPPPGGSTPSQQAGLPRAPRQGRGSFLAEEAAVRSIWRQMKGREAPWPGGGWRETGGVGGQSLGLGWGDLGAQAAKASVPADPSQRQESPPPCWERGSCRDVRSKHLRTSGSRNCSQGPASQGVWEVHCSPSAGPACSHWGDTRP